MNRAGLKDLLLPIAVVAVVGMMVFPLPSLVLDTLLMLNIAFALSLLISTVYLSRPESFTSLPTILLLTTLFRLGLNISTTRKILSEGEAPQIIAAFGGFVVNGNLVVGVVIFIIITLVQFLVIAKGSERVAEVAARFTLDAMPGKQMSIDADIRSGILSLAQARDKRLDLQRESKLFGALDGAMKFVKGDAIAGLIITILNISAGILIGLTQQSLSFGEAVNRYTLFTIGDGLVSQIPALLVAVAAGIAVTRVSDKEESFVGRELFQQLGKEPQAIAVTGLVLLVLALVPGLPSISFILLAVLLAFQAAIVQNKKDIKAAEAEERTFTPKIYSSAVFRISKDAANILQQEKRLSRLVQEIRNDIFENWGLIVPDVQFDLNQRATDRSVCISIKGVDVARVEAKEDGKFSEQVAAKFTEIAEAKLALFIDDTQTRQLLEIYQPLSEDLINNLIPDKISVTALTTILRELLREKVKISEFSSILQAISEFFLEKESGSISSNFTITDSRSSQTLRLLLEQVRIKLSRTISQPLIDLGKPVDVLILPEQIDCLLQQAASSSAPVPPNVIQTISSALDQVRAKSNVLLCSSGARGLLAECLAGEEESLAIFAYEELSPEIKISTQTLLPLSMDEAEEKPLPEVAEVLAA